MTQSVILLAIVIPGFLWAGYHYYHDRHQPEPILYLLIAFLLGCFSGLLGQLAYSALDIVGLRYDAFELGQHNRAGLLLYSLCVIGVIEEGAKFLPFWLIVLKFKHFDEVIDGIIYASFISLGFACYENFHYAQFMNSREMLARGLASPLVHAMFASVWGYHCGRAWIEQRKIFPAAIYGLLIAIILHGLYDFMIIGSPGWIQASSALLILSIWLWRIELLRRLSLRY